MTLRFPTSPRAAFLARTQSRARRRRLRTRAAGVAMLAAVLTSCVTQAVSTSAVSSAMPAPRPAFTLAVADFAPKPPSVAAGPSFLTGLSQRDRMRATLCLASALYYEAATEPDAGQQAVAQVVLNRVRHREWPSTVCGVVYEGSNRPGCQFSFACDGAMARVPVVAHWLRARRVAEAALAGATYAPVGSATFYHTAEVAPGWRLRMVPVGIVGAHIFYRLPADGAGAETLPFAYAGREPTPGPLPRVAPPAALYALTELPPVIKARPVASLPLDRPPAVATVAPSRDTRYVAGALPDSEVRTEWQDSGTWIAK